MLAVGDLASTASIPVIFYDQLGIGHSTHLHDKPQSFWTIDLFIDELVNLLGYLGIESDFDILGHSWGGQLRAEFEVRRQPTGLRHLVLSNPLSSMSLWHQSNKLLIEQLPNEEKEAIAAGPDVVPEKYSLAMEHFHSLHGCTVQPVPKELVYSKQEGVADFTVFNAMTTGELKDWTIVDRLHLVRVPTLVLNGRADLVQDSVCEPFFRNIKRVKWITFEASSHTPFWEERDRYMKVVP